MISDICRTCKYFNVSCKGEQLYHCDKYISNLKYISDLDIYELNKLLNNKFYNNIAELQSFYNEINEELKRRNLNNK